MNTPTDPLSPESETAEPAPLKPVRRRRAVTVSGEEGSVQQAGETMAEAPPQAAPAKAVRKRRETAPASAAAAESSEAPGIAPAPRRARKPASTATLEGMSEDTREGRDETVETPTRRAEAISDGASISQQDAIGAPDSIAVKSESAVAEAAVSARDDDRITDHEDAPRSDAEPGEAGASRQESDAHRAPDAPDAAAPDAAAADAHPERSRRRNRRERQRANRAAEGSAQAANGSASPVEPVPPQIAERLGTLFAQVVSGDFDAEDASADGDSTQAHATADAANDGPSEATREASSDVAADAASDASGEAGDVAAPKRVLAPEPDAPKLQKVLGQAGVGSRRDMEELIADGRVTVNGQPAHTGQRISWGDRIEVNGKAIKYRIAPPPARIVAYHKPVGEVVTHDDPQQRPTVFRNLPRLQHGKWQSVGRLDINTEGLLLFTTSGELANQLMHPRFGVEREYAVRVLGTLEPQAREKLLQGVMVEGQPANFKAIEDGGGEGANRWYRVVITEGRNRELRKLFDTVGLTVSRLIRIRYGSVVLPRGLKRGVWVDLSPDDVRLIRQLAGGGRSEVRANDGAPRAGRGPQGGERGPRPNDRGGRNDRGPRRDAPQTQGNAPVDRPGRDVDEDLDFDPMRIPNPLEQTFDRRFAKNQRSPFSGRTMAHGGGGFGAGGSAPEAAPKGGGGPKEPDPLQTSLSFIGGDAFHRKGGRGGGGGGGGGSGGPAGGNRGGPRGGTRSGGKGGQRGR